MFVILKPRKDWPNPELPKEELVSRIEGNLAKIPGNAYEITQPIQMRFNELIAGVRGDIAVKVFGDDFNQMNRTAEQIAAALRKTQGAADVKVEQTTGLPMLDIRVNRDAMARLRSEEHTSELQSLMRISYAVFCLKKKRKHHNSNKVKTS